MFGGQGGSKPKNSIECLIGAGTTIEGNITCAGGLRVDGRVCGDVISADGKPGTLVMTVRNGTCGVPTLLVQPPAAKAG